MSDKRTSKKQGLLQRLGGSFLGVWVIKRIISPLDRRLYRWTGGRGIGLGRALSPRLLLTTIGRLSGRERTVPIFYLRDGDRLIICNVNPGFEQPNPWTLNLRAHPLARVQMGLTSGTYQAHEATAAEVERYWPRLVAIWPAYQAFYDRGGERTIFMLEPDREESSSGGPDSRPRATSAPFARGGEAGGALRER
jgi:deazaflavin-dependent oxidoreductase (nitroreductase family)